MYALSLLYENAPTEIKDLIANDEDGGYMPTQVY